MEKFLIAILEARDLQSCEVHIEKSYDMIYNDDEEVRNLPKLVRWAAMFKANTLDEIDYILGSDLLDMDMKQEFLKCIEKVSQNEDVVGKVTLEENYDMMMASFVVNTARKASKEAVKVAREKALKEGRSKGIKEGIKEGKKQSTIDFIKSMLDNNIDLDLIAKITNMSRKEIKAIANLKVK